MQTFVVFIIIPNIEWLRRIPAKEGSILQQPASWFPPASHLISSCLLAKKNTEKAHCGPTNVKMLKNTTFLTVSTKKNPFCSPSIARTVMTSWKSDNRSIDLSCPNFMWEVHRKSRRKNCLQWAWEYVNRT